MPSARLAEAIAAKAIATYNNELLIESVRLDPHNPLYLYLLAGSRADFNYENNLSQVRRLLELALRIDPDYLPALYAYALTKHTYEQRLAALEHIATIDSGNAKPYYLMAVETFHKITEGRKISEATKYDAFDLSQQEWQSISDLIQKGNEQPYLRWSELQLPSTRDLKVTTQGKVWPKEAVDSNMMLFVDFGIPLMNGDTFDTSGFAMHATMRQLSRQAKWAAKSAYAKGDTQAAFSFLDTARALGLKYASSQPYRMIPFLVGYAVVKISASVEEEMFKKSNDLDKLSKLQENDKSWKNAIKSFPSLMNEEQVTVENIYLAPNKHLKYTNYAIEEAGVKKALASLKPVE